MQVDTLAPLCVNPAQGIDTIVNSGTATLYYKSSGAPGECEMVGLARNDGTLAPGQTLAITTSTWLRSAGPQRGDIELTSAAARQAGVLIAAAAVGHVMPAVASPALAVVDGSGGGWGGLGGGIVGDAKWRPYAATSPFNKLVVPGTPEAQIHPSSQAIIGKLFGIGGQHPANLVIGSAELATEHDVGHPTYYARPDDPEVILQPTESTNLQGTVIRVPAAAKPGHGSDKHMCIIQPDGTEYDLWHYQERKAGSPEKIVFGIGGKTIITGSGLVTPIGATAANFALLAGIIRAPELIAGEINHALFMTVKECAKKGKLFGHGAVEGPNSAYVYPASHGAASAEDETLPPCGARLWLAMNSAEIEALKIKWYKKTILRALASYGAYIGDTGGVPFGFQLESGMTYKSFGFTDPLKAWAEKEGLSEGEGEFAGSFVLNMENALSEAEWKSKLMVLVPPFAS